MFPVIPNFCLKARIIYSSSFWRAIPVEYPYGVLHIYPSEYKKPKKYAFSSESILWK